MNNLIRTKTFWFFILILLVGIFLRSYNFSPWLHFELDQARDAIVIDEAMNGGVGDLPLLGPRAAGTRLRLGPASYYMEYVSSFLVGDSVVGSAYSVLFFSILSIVVTFFLFRRYFSREVSLLLLSIFAVSLFFITYSRFSWNPNFIPFFVTISLYSLLRLVDKNETRNGYWLVVCALFFGILFQLHFMSLIVVSIVSVIFLAYKRPKIQFKFWAAAIALFLLLNVPMLINEVKTGGDNFDQFMKAVFDKSEESDQNFIEKVVKNYSEHSLGYGIMMTGYQEGQLPSFRKDETGYDIKCDRYCRDHLIYGGLFFIFISLGLVLLVMRLFREREVAKKDFLALSTILFVISFLVFTPLAFDLSPRFFLVSCVIPFVFFGLILERLVRIKKNTKIGILLTALLIILNLFFVLKFFNELKLTKSDNVKVEHDRIMKQKTRITLEQQNTIVDYLSEQYESNKYPILYKGQNEFHRAFAYLLDERGVLRDSVSNTTIYRNANYFLILRTQSNLEPFEIKYGENYDFISKKEFGTLSVFKLKPKEDRITDNDVDSENIFRESEVEDEDSYARRFKWKEVF
ncbi:ArnT family glycosyltransferase [Patescibacteria group bacterium]